MLAADLALDGAKLLVHLLQVVLQSNLVHWFA